MIKRLLFKPLAAFRTYMNRLQTKNIEKFIQYLKDCRTSAIVFVNMANAGTAGVFTHAVLQIKGDYSSRNRLLIMFRSKICKEEDIQDPIKCNKTLAKSHSPETRTPPEVLG